MITGVPGLSMPVPRVLQATGSGSHQRVEAGWQTNEEKSGDVVDLLKCGISNVDLLTGSYGNGSSSVHLLTTDYTNGSMNIDLLMNGSGRVNGGAAGSGDIMLEGNQHRDASTKLNGGEW